MTTPVASSPRTRRALLGAALGAAAATVATAIGRPLPANASVYPLCSGTTNIADARTDLARNNSGTALTVSAADMPPYALQTEVVAIGTNVSDPALRVVSTAAGGTAGAFVANQAGAYALTATALGSGSVGFYTTGQAIGVSSHSDGAGGLGVAGEATGALGVGVYGDGFVGVKGHGSNGYGVQGEATSGVGGGFSATTGTALQVTGKARFSRSGKGIDREERDLRGRDGARRPVRLAAGVREPRELPDGRVRCRGDSECNDRQGPDPAQQGRLDDLVDDGRLDRHGLRRLEQPRPPTTRTTRTTQ